VLASRDAKSFTVEQRKKKRRGRVFIDYLRNAYAQHAIAPYSVRARPAASVAMPLQWNEVGDSKLHAQKYTIENAFRRLSQKGDVWKDISRHAASLKKARRELDDLLQEEDVA
jgi:bifunctional non-homologous end joining protein LigD